MADRKLSASTAITAPDDADLAMVVDVSDTTDAATGTNKKITWANIKATLKTYFDTLYAAVSHTHSLSNITDVTASASELNTLDGITASTTELNYTDGVTSAIQTQLDAKSTDSKTETLTNKTIDANGTGNSITNIEVADLASGVLDTDLTSVSASDNTIPSAKATKTYADTKASASHTHAQSDVTGLTTDLAAKVTGPSSATDNEVPRYDGTTGKLIQGSGATIADNGYMLLTGSIETPGAVVSDTISEHTTNAGITVDGVLLKDGDVTVADEAYDATNWNGSLEVPTKNAVRDKIESLGGGGTCPLYGDGSDGDATITVNTTLSRDMYYNNLAIDPGVTITPSGYRIFVNAALTGSGSILDAGTNATTNSGASTRSATVMGAGGAGGSGTTTNGSQPAAVTLKIGGNGGAGGAGTSGSGGSAQTGTASSSSGGGTQIVGDVLAMRTGTGVGGAIGTRLGGGTGGSGGGGNGANAGGGGGSGGGNLYVAARTTSSFTGTIGSPGGNGANGTASNCGGGGGGGGGTTTVVTESTSQAFSTNVAGGTGGSSGGGSGVAGSNGSAGTAKVWLGVKA